MDTNPSTGVLGITEDLKALRSMLDELIVRQEQVIVVLFGDKTPPDQPAQPSDEEIKMPPNKDGYGHTPAYKEAFKAVVEAVRNSNSSGLPFEAARKIWNKISTRGASRPTFNTHVKAMADYMVAVGKGKARRLFKR